MNKSLFTTFSFNRIVTLMIKENKTDEIDRDEKNRDEDENDDENERAREKNMKI